MTELSRRIRGAIGLGLSWAAVGFMTGGVIELIHNIWPNRIGAVSYTHLTLPTILRV